MLKHVTACVVALLLMPTVAAAGDCQDWQATVLPTDRPSMAVTVGSLLDRLPEQPFSSSPEFVADQTRALDKARDLLVQAEHPLPLGDITGAWRVASIQVSSSGFYDYPYFAARIERAGCGYRFAKSTGSQRRTGRLLPMKNDRALAFLGTFTVNDDPTASYGPDNRSLGLPAGPDGPTNSVGRLMRLGPDTLLMILDAHVDDNAFELYRLQR